MPHHPANPVSLEPERPARAPCVIADRYQLLERIGEGGMGVVWRGFDLDLEEIVALKFLREDLADDERRQACFRREARLARHVTHPNVARVFEFGRDRGLYFLTMEFIAGESLQSVLARQGWLAPQRVYRRAIGLCRGLAAAHAAGIVHGDIKPGNILMSPQRGAVLTDFGIARAVSEVLGRDESIGGTPPYMAPEQIVGGRLALQSDIYAAGVVLFEALTGELPWDSADPATLLTLKTGPEPDLRALAPGLPEAWARLIARCLQRDPAQRPPDGRALLACLRDVGVALDGGRPETTRVDRRATPAPEARHVGDTRAQVCGPGSAVRSRGDGSSGAAVVVARRVRRASLSEIDTARSATPSPVREPAAPVRVGFTRLASLPAQAPRSAARHPAGSVIAAVQAVDDRRRGLAWTGCRPRARGR